MVRGAAVAGGGQLGWAKALTSASAGAPSLSTVQ